MTKKTADFDLYLPNNPEKAASTKPIVGVRKFATRLIPGKMRYEVKHSLGTEEVIVQTRIAGRIREGGVSIADSDTVHIEFGGPLNEEMDVIIIG